MSTCCARSSAKRSTGCRTVEGTAGDVHISNDLTRLLNLTDKLAQKRKDQYISSELFVLAAVEDKGQLGDLLRKAGASQRRD